MKIRNKLLIYFSSIVISLTGISFFIIYLFFSSNREEQFQQRQKQKIKSTLEFLYEIKKTDLELIEALDKLTINDLFDEKLLLFNSDKELIYTSIDDTPISISTQIISSLNAQKKWIETKEGLYDVVGTYIENDGKIYYGISKAYDTFGYTKLDFLRNMLFSAFLAIIVAVFIVSFYVSKRISKPLTDLSNLLSTYRLGENQLPQSFITNTFEINLLFQKFNELVQRTHEAFSFQKQSIHHISHELKTPISVLISELERIKKMEKEAVLKEELENQIQKTKSLADIINVLLLFSKAEAGQTIDKENIRMDEIIFDCMDELNTIFPNFLFEINFIPEQIEPENLVLVANEMLIKQAIRNLLSNCITYSTHSKAEIEIDCSHKNELLIRIKNIGSPLSPSEESQLFKHFFRGENSRGKVGFGLGLVLTKQIVELNSGTITYLNPKADLNVFEIHFLR